MVSTINRRQVLWFSGLAAPVLGHAALAQTGRAGRAIVGFPPGGNADSVTRLYAERIKANGGAQMIVDNRPGAGGRLALEALKPLAPDGSALVVTPASMLTIYPHLYAKTLRYQPLQDFTPVSPLCIFPFALAVAARHPAKSVQEFVDWGKKQPQGVSWASPVPGSMPHFIGTEFARMTGVTMSHIPYRGAAPAVSDLLGGTIHAVLVPLGEVTAFHRAGDARILAISASARLPKLSSVPTLVESGFPDLVHEEWYGVVLPAGARPETLSTLHRAIAEAAASPQIADALARIDIAPFTMEPAAYRERIAQEAATWGPIVTASGFQPDD